MFREASPMEMKMKLEEKESINSHRTTDQGQQISRGVKQCRQNNTTILNIYMRKNNNLKYTIDSFQLSGKQIATRP